MQNMETYQNLNWQIIQIPTRPPAKNPRTVKLIIRKHIP